MGDSQGTLSELAGPASLHLSAGMRLDLALANVRAAKAAICGAQQALDAASVNARITLAKQWIEIAREHLQAIGKTTYD